MPRSYNKQRSATTSDAQPATTSDAQLQAAVLSAAIAKEPQQARFSHTSSPSRASNAELQQATLSYNNRCSATTSDAQLYLQEATLSGTTMEEPQQTRCSDTSNVNKASDTQLQQATLSYNKRRSTTTSDAQLQQAALNYNKQRSTAQLQQATLGYNNWTVSYNNRRSATTSDAQLQQATPATTRALNYTRSEAQRSCSGRASASQVQRHKQSQLQ